MTVKIPASEQNSKFQTTPAGTHAARCYRVIEYGHQKVTWKDETKEQYKVLISWELPNAMMEPDDEHPEPRPFTVHKKFTLSMHENANLRKILESWYGRSFESEEQSRSVDLEDLIGKTCILTVTHRPMSNGGTWSDVATVQDTLPGMEIPDPINEPVFFSFGDSRAEEAWEKLSEGIQKQIKASPEYKAWTVDTFKKELEEAPVSAEDIPF